MSSPSRSVAAAARPGTLLTTRIKQAVQHPFCQIAIILVVMLIVFVLLEYQMNRSVREVRRLRLLVMQKTSKDSMIDTLGLRDYYHDDSSSKLRRGFLPDLEQL
jgi:hypothetical protein